MKITKEAKVRALKYLLGFSREGTAPFSDFIRDREDFVKISDEELIEAMKWVTLMLEKKLNEFR